MNPLSSSDSLILGRIAANKDMEQDLEDQVRQLVYEALELGCTWKEIGSALGVTSQAAWERYRPRELPPPMHGGDDSTRSAEEQ